MQNEIVDILRNEDRFLVVTHVNPDGDAIGSLMGMFLGLVGAGKRAWPLIRDDVPDLYDFMPGLRQVIQSPESMDARPDWIIAVDCAERSRIAGDIERFDDRARLINIDHHPTNPQYGDFNLVIPEAASSAEIVFDLLKGLGPVSPDAAMCLYTGLITDTGGFKFSGVKAETMRVAAEMMDTGFDPYEVATNVFERHPLGRLDLERLMLERAEILFDGAVIMSTLYAKDFDELGLKRSDAENLIDVLRAFRGVEVAALVVESDDGKSKGSLRSKKYVDVAAIAKSMGGGGHYRAAGFRTDLRPADTHEMVKRELHQVLAESNGRR